MTDIEIRAAALDAAIRSLRPVTVGGGTSHGYLADPPSVEEVINRAKDFTSFILKGN